MSDLPPHHIAYLEGRPDRSEAWLRARIRDGFEVHHIDGNHSNNDPGNLALIEGVDHMKLHGFHGLYGARLLGRWAARRRQDRTGRDPIMVHLRAKTIYGLRLLGHRWGDIGRHFGMGIHAQEKAINEARAFAKAQGVEWPPVVTACATKQLIAIDQVSFDGFRALALGEKKVELAVVYPWERAA